MALLPREAFCEFIDHLSDAEVEKLLMAFSEMIDEEDCEEPKIYFEQLFDHAP